MDRHYQYIPLAIEENKDISGMKNRYEQRQMSADSRAQERLQMIVTDLVECLEETEKEFLDIRLCAPLSNFRISISIEILLISMLLDCMSV